ncbi:hypothetical protein CN378_06040 [Bacillus sp. AFS015802]|uniref:hypothetical protein n=1 Tax=Bacillus sp. AFS015802 TaxID=2033486 RepID=UPI000BF594D2|nr:hypothetical protein [Bacillus sp. AFS015802]PFA68765.1 hypothetical protein CN378_06040 [Bacillus sp. AFS015802]
MSNNNTKNLNLSSLLDSTMKEVLKEKVEFILQEEIKEVLSKVKSISIICKLLHRIKSTFLPFLFTGIGTGYSQRVFKGYSKRYIKQIRWQAI